MSAGEFENHRTVQCVQYGRVTVVNVFHESNMPFIVESFAIYTFVRRFIPIRRKVRYLG